MPVNTAPSVRQSSSVLRAATREEHLAVEADVDLADLERLDGLTDFLSGWQAVWLVISRAAFAPGACVLAQEELGRPATEAVGWLRADLAGLAGWGRRHPDRGVPSARTRPDSPTGAPARLPDLLSDPASTWGVAYVLRGSRLGGAVLAARLSRALPAGCGTSFLESAGTDQGRDWVAFRRRLDSFALAPLGLDAAIEAARWTFGWVAAELSSAKVDRAILVDTPS